MSEFSFLPATKEQAKARIALTGPSGSGKTYTALITATRLGERVALIDTERGSAAKYADEFHFDTLQLTTFEPTTLVKALAAAADAGYDVVVVDSLSHFWSGTGGMLEQVDSAAKRLRSATNFVGWKEVRPLERAMIDALLSYPGHVIVTMRSKTEYVVEPDEKGRIVPRKIGLRPEQREGIEYEFDLVGDLDHENTLVVSKSRAKSLAGAVIRKPDDSFAESVLAWLEVGEPAPVVSHFLDRVRNPEASYADLRALYEELRRRNLLAVAVLDEEGQTTTLGDLVARRGSALKALRAVQ